MRFAFNPFTSNLDVVKPDNFSYNNIIENKTITIPQNQQMPVFGILRNDGLIINEGQIISEE